MLVQSRLPTKPSSSMLCNDQSFGLSFLPSARLCRYESVPGCACCGCPHSPVACKTWVEAPQNRYSTHPPLMLATACLGWERRRLWVPLLSSNKLSLPASLHAPGLLCIAPFFSPDTAPSACGALSVLRSRPIGVAPTQQQAAVQQQQQQAGGLQHTARAKMKGTVVGTLAMAGSVAAFLAPSLPRHTNPAQVSRAGRRETGAKGCSRQSEG